MAMTFTGLSTPYLITNQAQSASITVAGDGVSNTLILNLNNLPLVMNVPPTNGPTGVRIGTSTRFVGTYLTFGNSVSLAYNYSTVYNSSTCEIILTFSPGPPDQGGGIVPPPIVPINMLATISFTFYYTSL